MKVLFRNTSLKFEKYQHVNFTDNSTVNKALFELYVNDSFDMSTVKKITITNCTEIGTSQVFQFGINFYNSSGTNMSLGGIKTGSLAEVRAMKRAVIQFSHGYFIIDPTGVVSEGQATDRLSVDTWSNYTDINNSPKIKKFLGQ